MPGVIDYGRKVKVTSKPSTPKKRSAADPQQTKQANAKIQAAQRSTNEAAAQAALQSAYEEAKRQALLRAAARQRAELARRAALARNETRRLIQAGRTSSAAEAGGDVAQLHRLAAERSRQVAKRASDRRHQAYGVLKDQTHRQLAGTYYRREAQQIAGEQADRAKELASRQARFTFEHQAYAEGIGPGATVRRPVDQRRERVLQKAKVDHDYSDAIEMLDRQSRETGGRYVDPELYDAVQNGYVKDVVKTGKDYESELKKAQRLFDAEDAAGLQKLIESKRFLRLEEQFREYFGDGRKPGSFARDAKTLTEIAKRRERVWVSSLLDPSGSRSAYQVDNLVNDAYAKSEGMVYREKVLDPATGEYKVVKRTGIDAYLAREAARQQDAAVEANRVARNRLKAIMSKSRAAGKHVQAFYRDGRMVTVDLDQRQALDDAAALLPDGHARLQAVIDSTNPAQTEELTRNFMRDAASAWDAAHPIPRSRGVDHVHISERAQFLSQLKAALTGDTSGFGFFDQLGQSYGLGDVMRAAQTPLSSMLAWLREQRVRGNFFGWQYGAGGDYSLPTVDSRVQGNDPMGLLGIGTRNDPDGKAAYLAYEEALKSSDPNVRANATRAYGTGVIGGDLGWIVEGLADPLNAVAPGAWLSRARLAIATAGGAERLASLGGLSEAIAAYVKYSSPEFLGGLGRNALRTDLAKLALAREVGVPGREVLHMADDEIRELAEKSLRGVDELRQSDVFERLLERSDLDREQLLNIIQDKLPKIAEEFDLSPVNPFEMQARIRSAREGYARAQQQAEEAIQLERRRVAQAEARDALERARAAAGVDVGERVVVDAGSLAKHEKFLSTYVGVTREYSEVAGRAARAADELEKIGQVSSPDRGRLLGVHAQLKRALADMQKYEDQFRVWEGERRLVKEGLVARSYRDLAEYRKSIGGDPSAPSYVNLSWSQVRQDRRMLQSRIRGLQAALARATDDAEMARLRSALVEAHKARVGVEFEAALLDRGRTMARTYGRRHLDRVKQAVRPQRLGNKAVDEAQRAVESSRDLSNRLGSIESIEDAPTLTAEEAKAVADGRAALESASGADVVSWVRALQTKRAGVRFAGESVNDVVAKLEELAASLGVDLSELSLNDLVLALFRVQRSSVDREAWAGVWKLVSSRAGAALKAAGWRGKLIDYVEALSWEHARRGSSFGLSRFEQLDKIVADALFELRKHRAEGVARGGGKRYGQAEARELLRPDSNPAWVLAKMRALRAEGVDLFEYDAARGVLGDVMVRRNTAAGMLKEARALAAVEGISLDDAFLRVRESRAATESLREFEEFASRFENQGRAPEQILRLFEERYVGRDLGSVPGLKVTSFQDSVLRQAWRELSGFDFEDQPARARWLQSTGTVPPLGDRSKMRAWLEENGYWSPRTGQQIASGERVWSIDEERVFFEKNWGYTPPWADREVLAPLMNDQRALKASFGEWGFFDDGFEELIGGSDLTPEQTLDAVVWGREGFSGKRTLEEMRQWAFQRYGDLVAREVKDHLAFFRMPWLMGADHEYLRWINRSLSDAGMAARRAEWEAAAARLPESIRNAFDAGYGLEVSRGLVKPAQIDKLAAAITEASRRRLSRLREAGDVDPGEWLPQEQLRFAYDVANELLADPSWRGLLRGTPTLGAALNIWSQFWRGLVSLTVPFAIMNLIDAYGPRRLMLAVFENGFRPLSRSGEGVRLVGSLREIGAESASLFHLAEGGQPWFRVRDKMLPVNIRGGAAIRMVVEAPLQISAFGEDALRLDFARSVAGRTYESAIKSGMESAAAEALARVEAKRMLGAFFVTGRSPGWLKALNSLVPFFSYNFELKRLAVRMVWEHPAIVAWGERIADQIKRANREAWEEEYPGVPFPEDDPSSSWLWIKVGEDFITVDLSTFSDWTRAVKDVTASQTAGDWINEFLRVPHPSQLAMLAWITGGTTPWGKPGSIRELSAWADLLMWMNGNDYTDPRWKRNWLQISGQMLFFKAFGRITPIKAKIQQYFWFRDLDPDKAGAYLEQNPDLKAYFDQLSGRGRFAPGGERSVHWYSLLSDEQRVEYDSAFAEWKDLNRALDERVFQYANEPWSEGYKQAKKEAYIARTFFLQQHPILTDSWGVFMSAGEFADLRDDWKVDQLADAFFAWERPSAADFKSDLAYQQALVAYYDDREAFLKANPALAERLYHGRNAIENAWHDQELHWSDVLEFQAKLKLRILEEQEKPEADQDREFIDVLYRWRDAASLELDGEAYARVYGVVVPGKEQRSALRLIRRSGGDLLRRVAEIPGFSDFIYGRATPEERSDIRRNEWYAENISEVVSKATDGKSFYQLLFKNPPLLQEYWRRNPDAKARYQAGQEYFRWISSWVARLQASDFDGAQSAWDSMPAWVRERYLAAHPDSGMADGSMGDTSSVQYNGQFFKSPASRATFIRGQEYYASISRWVQLLKAKDYVAADRWFRQMPSWMREKYYAKHPDQRAQHELDSQALRMGAEYFLAHGDDKLKILQKYPELRAYLARYGGDEGSMRGLVVAMYQAIPSSDAWLKRTFREHFPEYFSQESAGERRLADVARSLAENPEMLPFYKRAFALQTKLYTEQLRLGGTPPKPMTIERKRRHVKRRKRRAARFSSLWSMHRDLRRHRG